MLTLTTKGQQVLSIAQHQPGRPSLREALLAAVAAGTEEDQLLSHFSPFPETEDTLHELVTDGYVNSL